MGVDEGGFCLGFLSSEFISIFLALFSLRPCIYKAFTLFTFA